MKRFRRYAALLKWATLFLFAYVAVVFAARVPWGSAIHTTLVPHLNLDGVPRTATMAVA